MTFTLRQLSGESIGPYDLRELYGTGGMGAVYRAYQRNLERYVAFKVMSLSYAAQPEFVERFNREAKLAASLEHPHIVPIYDYSAMADWQYVVMRLLTGGSLAERVEQMKGQPPSMAEIGTLLQQLAGALDYAHSRNIVHRDIKSNNIMFDTHGTAYLVDFGIAKLIQDNATRLTADGMTVGTPTHMAPELWTGEDASPASDQYALAIVVYELLTGRVPFNATTPFALMTRHMQETPESVQKYTPHLNGELDGILWRALAKEKHERYPTVGAFARDFIAVAQRMPQPLTGMFTMALRRELLGTDPAQPQSVIVDTPQFSGMRTITPPSMPAPPAQRPAKPAPISTQPAAAGRPALKSLSALQRAQAAEAALSKYQAPANPLPMPEVIPVALPKPAVPAVRPTPTAAMDDAPAQPVKERIVFVERKEQKSKESREAAGCMQAVVESTLRLFGIAVSSTIRATLALVLSAVLTLALIIGVGVLIAAFLTSPAMAHLVNQLRTMMASIGESLNQTANTPPGVQPNFGGPPPPPPPPPPPGGFPPPPRR